MVKRCARLSLKLRLNVFARSSSSDSRPTSGARGPSVRTGLSSRSHQAPGSKWPVDALQLERAGVLDDEARCREPVRRRADQDLAGTGRALETRCQVDRFTRRECRLGSVDDHLAGFDSDPGLQLEVVDRFAHGQRCSRGSLRVVLVCLWDTERRHDRIPGELLDDAAVLRHALRDRLEELVHPAPHHLRVGSGHQPCRVDDVDEQHRCELALHV